MSVQKVQSRKAIIANVIKSCADQHFYTTFTDKEETWSATRRLLVLDSSFNPPTKAHAQLLRTALESKPANYFDGTLLLFSTNNADKKLTGASVLQRAQMMELMAGSFESIAVGLTPHGKFIDKAQSIQSWFKHPVQLTFILGYDTITRFFDSKYYSPVPVKEALAPFFTTSRLICADRGSDTDGFWEGIGKDYERFIDRIHLDPETEAISSTKARLAIASHDDSTIHSLLDDAILQFVLQEHLYTSE